MRNTCIFYAQPRDIHIICRWYTGPMKHFHRMDRIIDELQGCTGDRLRSHRWNVWRNAIAVSTSNQCWLTLNETNWQLAETIDCTPLVIIFDKHEYPVWPLMGPIICSIDLEDSNFVARVAWSNLVINSLELIILIKTTTEREIIDHWSTLMT